MTYPSISQTIHPIFSRLLLPDGSYVVRRGLQEIEVWGVNISDHYTIRVAPADAAKMDVIYLGSELQTLNH